MFHLGVYLRKRYAKFLTFNPRELDVRSSEIDRCLETAQLVASGSYPPKGDWIWHEFQSWQPFPIKIMREKHV